MGTNFPDSLAVGAAAARDDAPVVLLDGQDSDGVPAALLDDLEVERIVIVGGTSAVASDVALALEDATGIKPTRVAGEDRYDTAARLALAGWSDGADVVAIATGQTFPDALAGAPAAAELDDPILLTRGDEVPSGAMTSWPRTSDTRQALDAVRN